MTGKSKRIKRLENELANLEQWMRLGLVPKNDTPRFQREMDELKVQIVEESKKIQLINKHNHLDNIATAKKSNKSSISENYSSNYSRESSEQCESNHSTAVFNENKQRKTIPGSYSDSGEIYEDLAEEYGHFTCNNQKDTNNLFCQDTNV